MTNAFRKKYQICMFPYDVCHSNYNIQYNLRKDHIAIKPEECVQQNHNYAIIDELDSILIDDADEPHIIGGGNSYNAGNIFKENYLIKF